MSNASIDDLFGQILDCEQKAQIRKSKLNEVKNEIHRIQELVNKIVSEKKDMTTDQIAKRRQLCDEEMILKSLSNKRELLQSKSDGIKGEIERHRDDVVKAKEEINKLQEMVCLNCTEFENEFGLTKSTKTERQAKKRHKLETLKHEIHELRKEISDVQSQNATVVKLRQQKQDALQELDAVLQRVKDKQDKLEKLRTDTTTLENEGFLIAGMPQSDDEFCRLRSELQSCDIGSREFESKQLWQKLQHLQKDVWQTQVQRQRNTLWQHRQSDHRHQENPPSTAGIQKSSKDQMLISISGIPQNDTSNELIHQDKMKAFGDFELMEEFLDNSF